MALTFDFSFEQQLLGNSVAGTLDRFPAVMDRAPFDYPPNDVLSALAGLGLFATENGAPVLGLVDAVAASIEIGRRLPAAPLIETLAAALAFAPTQAEIAGEIDDGRIVGVAVAGSLEVQDGRATGRLLVPFGGAARLALAPAGPAGQRPWVLFEAGSAATRPAGVFDIASEAAWLELAGVPVRATNAPAAAAFDAILCLLALAEMTGAAAACLETTVAYVKERKQFGKPVGSYQAVKHMAADAAVAHEGMKAAIEYVAWCLDGAAGGDAEAAEEADLALLSARSFVGDQAKRLAERCVQMHGGIAFTWEYGLHRYLRRINYRRATIVRPRDGREDLARRVIDGRSDRW